MGVFAAERGDVHRMQRWYMLTFVLGAIFIGGQVFEYAHLITAEGLTLSSSAYGSAFYLTTGFHGLHVVARPRGLPVRARPVLRLAAVRP